MIFTGVIFGGIGVATSEGGRLISALVSAAYKLRGSFEMGNGPGVMILISVPGDVGAPEPEGIRVTQYSRKRQCLSVDVGVPVGMVDSPELPAYLRRMLHEVLALADAAYRKKKIQFPLSDAELLVQRMLQLMGIAGADAGPGANSEPFERLPPSGADPALQRLAQHVGRLAEEGLLPAARSRPLKPSRPAKRPAARKRAPRLVAINHDEYEAKHVGRTPDGRQFFLTTPFNPATAVGANDGCEFVALYVFDGAGKLIEARIDQFGPRATMNEDERRRVCERRLEDLGNVAFERIEVAPFAVKRFGTIFGLVVRERESEDDVWAVEAQPGNYMAFFEPWDGGDYDT